MNKLKKMLIKSDFFKVIEGHPTGWENVSLYYFGGSVYQLNKKMEEDLALCLSYVIGERVNVLPNFCSERELVFTVNDVSNVLYALSEGTIKPVWNASDTDLMKKAQDFSSELDIINKSYLELMEAYKTVMIPLTERVSYCYSFYGGYWFQLSDKKDDSKHINIREFVSDESYVDTDDGCYFSSDDLEVLIKRIRINPSYDTDIKKLNEDLCLRIKKLKNDLGITKKKRKDKDISDSRDYESFVVKDVGINERFIIREDNLFIVVDGVKCVREEWKRYLRYLDLANISFAGVYIAGLDFTGSNATINPELVYNKDVSMCKFDRNNLVTDAYCSDDCVINNFDISVEYGRRKR